MTKSNALFTRFLAVLVLLLFYGCDQSVPRPDRSHSSEKSSHADIVGTSHVRGGYFLSEQDYLNEGAGQVLGMGSRVIKVWFYNGSETPGVMYPFGSDWPEVESLVQGAELPYWRDFFSKPFTTVILNVMSMGRPDYYWLDGITDEEIADEQRQMYELGKYLLEEYRNTGKTFIFANHETDWHLKGAPDPDTETPPHVFDNAIKWFSARQRGVEQARREVGMEGVRLFHAGEVVNVIKSLRDGQDNMVNRILPYVNFDLISYSAWDSTVLGGVHPDNVIVEALDYIAENALESEHFGTKNVYIGEYGIPENDFGKEAMLNITKNVVNAGLDWGCPWIVYWQLYCNEPRPDTIVPSWKLDEFRGFWLIRPDGSKTSVYDYFVSLFIEKEE